MEATKVHYVFMEVKMFLKFPTNFKKCQKFFKFLLIKHWVKDLNSTATATSTRFFVTVTHVYELIA